MTLKKEKNPESSVKLKRLRIFFEDPDLTDTSDTEQDAFPKRQVKEILIGPVHHIPAKTLPKQKPTPKHDPPTPTKAPVSVPAPATSATSIPGAPCTRPTKYKGVRLRKWGKWAAEIRNPFTSKRVWLGTFDTAEEAKAAYDSSAAKFLAEKERLKSANSSSNSCETGPPKTAPKKNPASRNPESSKPVASKKLKKTQEEVSPASSSSSTKPETKSEIENESKSEQETKSSIEPEPISRIEPESKSQIEKGSKSRIPEPEEPSIAELFAQQQVPIPDLGGLFGFYPVESGLESGDNGPVNFDDLDVFDDLPTWDEDQFDTDTWDDDQLDGNDFANIDTWLNLEICAGH